MNERLRTAMLRSGVDPSGLADAAGVDAKTVSRWLGGRVPHRRSRVLIAHHLGEDEAALWPSTRPDQAPGGPATAEVVGAWAAKHWIRPQWNPDAGRETFGSYVSRWYAAQDLAASTMQNYQHHIEEHLLPAFEDFAVADIGPGDVAAWEKRERAAGSPVSVSKYRVDTS